MYFAVEPAPTTLPEQILRALADLQNQHAGLVVHLFALVDGAFDGQLLATRPWKQQPQRSLYENTRLQDFGSAAPILLSAPSAPADQLSWLQNIVQACTGKPMLSVLASTLDASALQQHVRPYLVACTPDGMQWPLRWADTRVLPELLAALTPEQQAHVLAPLLAWWSPRRDGTLQSWHGAATPTVAPAPFEMLPLTDAAFTALVDAAEADAVLANIEDSQPDVLLTHPPAQCHARVSSALVLASRHGIEAAPQRQHFCVLVLSVSKDFAQHPAMLALLEQVGQGADYSRLVGALPAQFWDDNHQPLCPSSDHRPSAQGNLVAGSLSGASGNSPAWFGSAHGRHGQSEDSSTDSSTDNANQGGHANAAAQWGIRTQEWGGTGAGGGGGAGYNQLVFDDTDHQSRIQLKTTQYSTELNMGHLIHTADNHRGSLRGQGFELRTDAYGAVRAGAGLMFTTYGCRRPAPGQPGRSLW